MDDCLENDQPSNFILYENVKQCRVYIASIVFDFERYFPVVS